MASWCVHTMLACPFSAPLLWLHLRLCLPVATTSCHSVAWCLTSEERGVARASMLATPCGHGNECSAGSLTVNGALCRHRVVCPVLPHRCTAFFRVKGTLSGVTCTLKCVHMAQRSFTKHGHPAGPTRATLCRRPWHRGTLLTRARSTWPAHAMMAAVTLKCMGAATSRERALDLGVRCLANTPGESVYALRQAGTSPRSTTSNGHA